MQMPEEATRLQEEWVDGFLKNTRIRWTCKYRIEDGKVIITSLKKVNA